MELRQFLLRWCYVRCLRVVWVCLFFRFEAHLRSQSRGCACLSVHVQNPLNASNSYLPLVRA